MKNELIAHVPDDPRVGVWSDYGERGSYETVAEAAAAHPALEPHREALEALVVELIRRPEGGLDDVADRSAEVVDIDLLRRRRELRRSGRSMLIYEEEGVVVFEVDPSTWDPPQAGTAYIAGHRWTCQTQQGLLVVDLWQVRYHDGVRREDPRPTAPSWY